MGDQERNEPGNIRAHKRIKTVRRGHCLQIPIGQVAADLPFGVPKNRIRFSEWMSQGVQFLLE